MSFPDAMNHRPPAAVGVSMEQNLAAIFPGSPSIPSLKRPGEPTPQELEAAAERFKYNKLVKVKGNHVRIFDLSVPTQATAYEELYVELYRRVGLKEVLITDRAKQFVPLPNGGTWLVHLEWLEYELEKTEVKPIPSA